MRFSLPFFLFIGCCGCWIVKQAPTCIHLDMEPHGSPYPEWDDEPNRPQLFNDFLDALESVVSQRDAILSPDISLCLAADIPNWYDGETKRFDRHGSSVLPSEAVARIVDKVVIMDYTTDVGLMLSRVENEVQFAGQVNGRIVVGSEIDCDQGADLSFCTFSDEVLEGALESVVNEYGSSPGFEGVALHWVEPYYERSQPATVVDIPRQIWSWNLLYTIADGELDVYLEYLRSRKVNVIYLCVNDFWEEEIAEILNKTAGWATIELLLGDNARWIYEGRPELDTLVSKSAHFLNDLIVIPPDEPNSNIVIIGAAVGGVFGGFLLIVAIAVIVIAIVIASKRGGISKAEFPTRSG